MARTDEFTAHVLDQLEVAGEVRARRMFGGTGVYVDDVFCAIVTGSGSFFLRVGDANRADFEAEGMRQFSGRGDSRMPYFEVPARVLEDPDELADWVGRARDAAVAARSSPKPKKRRR